MLDIKNLKKEFNLPYGSTLRAVDDLSVTLKKGDFAIVIGPNGAGKSTLFDLVAGRMFPDSGHILFEGRDITYHPPHKRSGSITLISQMRGAGLPKAMTVREVMRLALEMKRSSKSSSIDKKIISRLEDLEPGLSKIADNQVWHLSGGEYQLVALSVATVLCELSENGNHIILLDEHISQLAPDAKDRVLSATTDLIGRESITAMLATHSPDIAIRIGNRQIVMANGRIISDYSGGQVIKNVSVLRDVLQKAESLYPAI